MIPYEKQKFNNAKEVYTLIASLFVGIDSFLKKRIIKKKIDENKNVFLHHIKEEFHHLMKF